MIDGNYEDISTDFADVGGVAAKNLFLVNYYNKKNQFAKEYYILIDYGKNEADLTKYANNQILNVQ